MANILEEIARVWCRLTHHAVTIPIHGRYTCQTCWREFAAFKAVR